jgi:hypothetical protein
MKNGLFALILNLTVMKFIESGVANVAIGKLSQRIKDFSLDEGV